MQWIAIRLSLSSCALSAPQHLLHAGRWLARSSSALCQVLFFVLLGNMPPSTPVQTGGGAGLDADCPSMRQVVLGSRVTSSRE